MRIAGAVLHTGTTAAADGTAGPASVRESIRYLHRDHLGSVRAVTDADGTVVARAAYDPFGGRRLPDGTREAGEAERAAAAGDAALDPARGFTGHEQLDRLGLVHMGGRVHDPRLGRFLSPDPVVGDPGSSQSWHAYSYVGNSPMSFTDPTGLVRAPMPWERDPCSRVSGCLNLNGGGGGGGFGSGTARDQGVRGYLNVWVSWVLLPTGYDRDVIGFEWIPRLNISFGLARTFTDVAVPAEKRPADRPARPGQVGIYFPGADAKKGEHHYRIIGFICSRSTNPECNEEWANKVFEHVNRNDVPFYSGSKTGPGRYVLWGNNPIIHEEYVTERRSVNVADEGHLLYKKGEDNRVEHKVYFDNGDLLYEVDASGVNDHPRLNNAIGVGAFGDTVSRVVDRYGDPPNRRPLWPSGPMMPMPFP